MVTFLYLNIEAWVSTTIRNQHWDVVNFLHFNSKVWVPTIYQH